MTYDQKRDDLFQKLAARTRFNLGLHPGPVADAILLAVATTMADEWEAHNLLEKKP